jgi:short-subunit dehydrogenase
MQNSPNKKPTALITGASSGIGLELAKVIAREGHDLVITGRNADALEALAGQLEGKFGVKVTVIVLDLAGKDAPQELFESVRERQIEIGILVNNAGFGLGGPFVETDISREIEMIDLNIKALTHLTKLFLGPMIALRSGRIMNVASTASFQPGPLMSVYYASKAYVLSFSEAVAEEVRGKGVTITTFCPGPTATGFAQAAGLENSRLFGMGVASAKDAAEFGYSAMMSGKRIAVPGLRNKFVAQANRFAPRSLVTRISRKVQENR